MQLTIHLHGHQVQSIRLHPGEHTLGRSPENDICLPDPGVSRQHAVIQVSPEDRVTLIDKGSTNGTRVDGTRISSHTWDDPEVIVTLGNYQLRRSLPLEKKTQSTPAVQPAASTLASPTPVAAQRTDDEAIPPEPISDLQPDSNEKTECGRKKGRRNFIEPLLTVMMTVLVVPFIVFAAQHLFNNDSLMAEIEQRERQKSKAVQANKEQITLSLELAKASHLIEHSNFDPAQELLREILVKYPENNEALVLQETIRTTVAERKAEAEENERKRLRLQKEQELQQKKQVAAQLKTQIQKQMAAKDYTACLETAERLNTLDPSNPIAAQGLSVCSKKLLEAGAETKKQQAGKQEEEKPKERILLEKILAQGDTLLKQQKTNGALRTWAKAERVDPNNKYAITKTITAKRQALIDKIARHTREQIDLGKKAGQEQKPLLALKHFRTAYKLSPSDNTIKKLIIEQIQQNSKQANGFYEEAIAYASLGSTDEAVNLLKRAIQLSDGNTTLREQFQTKLTELK